MGRGFEMYGTRIKEGNFDRLLLRLEEELDLPAEPITRETRSTENGVRRKLVQSRVTV